MVASFLILWLFMLFSPEIVKGFDPPVIAVGRFSDMTPGAEVPGWEPMTFEKITSHTRYALVERNGRIVLRADSSASASGLVRKVEIDPTVYPVLTWNWRISNTVATGDGTKKSGDDYAAQIYITFAENTGQFSFFQRTKIAAIRLFYGKTPPSAALAYVWGNRAGVGPIHPNPHTDRVQMIPVESGPAHVNRWRSFRRDIVKDYQRAFGTDPPKISGIAVMTDTDNTGGTATAWYGDITFHRR